MNFGNALEILKDGGRVQRAGWNGKDMWLILLIPGDEPDHPCDGYTHIGDNQERKVDPCIAMKTAGNSMQPGWLASQADLLAEDWAIVSA